MPMSTQDVPEVKARVKARTPDPEPEAAPEPDAPAMADATTSTDPAVQKLMWDRGVHVADAGPGSAQRVAAIDAELAKLGHAV